jgi:hypothetical protein
MKKVRFYMKKMLMIAILCSFAFSQAYHIQSYIGIKDGVRVADYEKAMIQHNKAHVGLGCGKYFFSS